MEKIKRPIGRPVKPMEELLVAKSIRLTAKQWKTLDSVGVPRLRELLDSGSLSSLRLKS